MYVLGAGFSAPLRIPVTSNFMEAAEDMWLADDTRYGYFKGIFQLARSYGSIKSYYEADTLNIEEILSILQMQRDLQDESDNDLFIRFICDVIEYYSPIWEPFEGDVASNWEQQMWGRGENIGGYREFVGSLFVPSLSGTPRSARGVESFGHSKARYAVITFNYDRVLETLCENATHFVDSGKFAFRTGGDVSETPFAGIPALVKLHGDVKARNITPPTWNKGATGGELPAWKQAYAILSKASRIRFLGYSLPVGDSYFKYLLKSALTDGRFLKEIDVLCLDPGQSVEKRYREFINFPKLRFTSTEVQTYLSSVSHASSSVLMARMLKDVQSPYRNLEQAHRDIFV